MIKKTAVKKIHKDSPVKIAKEKKTLVLRAVKAKAPKKDVIKKVKLEEPKPKTKAKIKTLVQPVIEEKIPSIEQRIVPVAAEVAKVNIAQPLKRPPIAQASIKPTSEIKKEVIPPREEKTSQNIIEVTFPIILKDLAVKLQEKSSILIKKFLDMRAMVTLNQPINEEMLEKLAKEMHFSFKKAVSKEEALNVFHEEPDDPKNLRLRAPVVTFMGHVDHGKTSLLDAIRKTKVAESEHGGITQHIGAYEVDFSKQEKKGKVNKITFLDTPGHEAFTALRSRGAKCTDIVVLVVAADDGAMPQTIEAIDHAKLANVPIIVAVNKIDKPGANPDKVKKQLADLGLVPEDWDGKTIFVNVSAKTLAGIDNLLEMILLESEMLELKANYEKLASGVVLEAKLYKDKGNVVTLLVQNGTLKLNDTILVDKYYAKVRAMFDEFGKPKIKAEPSCPVGVLGFSSLPIPGDKFLCVQDEKLAKELSQKRQEEYKLKQLVEKRTFTLEDLSEQIKQGNKIKELKLIIKADVQSSLEAINKIIEGLFHEEIKLNILHKGTGPVNISDVLMATVAQAMIIGFNVAIDDMAKEKAAHDQIEIRTYNIIYELTNELTQALEGLLEPKLKKIFLGRAFVKQVFKTSKSGVVAGSIVQKGKIMRNLLANILRNGQVVHEGKIVSLRRFKDDVKEVSEGLECGISLDTEDIRSDDLIEVFQIQTIQRKLT